MDSFDIGYVSKRCIQLTLVHQWMHKFPNNYLSFHNFSSLSSHFACNNYVFKFCLKIAITTLGGEVDPYFKRERSKIRQRVGKLTHVIDLCVFHLWTILFANFWFWKLEFKDDTQNIYKLYEFLNWRKVFSRPFYIDLWTVVWRIFYVNSPLSFLI